MPTLPFEILSNIADFLSKKDILHCSLVCRTWATPFQQKLWHTLKIDNPKKLKALCSVITKNNNNSNNNNNNSNNNTTMINHYTRKLFLVDRLGTSSSQLHFIQSHFQNLQYLFITRKCPWGIGFGLTEGLKLWKTLSELAIDLDGLVNFDAKDEFFEILPCLPNLVTLNITQLGERRTIGFKMKDFEEIHSHMPLLKSLSLFIDIQPLSKEDWASVVTVKPAVNLTCFKLIYGRLNYRWMYYFAHKYPNLSTLKSDAIEHYMQSMQDSDEDIQTLDTSSELFSRLETINLNTSGYFKQIHTLFWNISKVIPMSIKNLSHILIISPKKSSLIEDAIRIYTRSFGSTLETLSVKCTVPTNILRSIIPEFEYCPCLVELELEKCFSSIHLDFIFDRCKALQTLKIKTNLVDITDPYNTKEQHGLQTISLSNSRISSDTLHYLSYHCRKLRTIYLEGVKIITRLSIETSTIVGMPYTCLDALYCDNVLFCFENGIRTDDQISVLLIRQNNIDPPLEEAPEELESDPNPSLGKHDWYLLSGNTKSLDKDTFTIELLKTEEVDLGDDITERFFDLRQEFKEIAEKEMPSKYTMLNFIRVVNVYAKTDVGRKPWARVK
ncbi:hypothetical protein CLU79DRAFT_734630 [Phycomyces nitens]|nr:hypothetical protein CLU79DRAFT_734630 [Phycomyces nitens]